MTTTDTVDTWTLDHCRDWLAENDGWVRRGQVAESHVVWGDPQTPTATRLVVVRAEVPPWRWGRTSTTGETEYRESHPIPDTLDAAASALPKGWTFCMSYNADVLGGFTAEAYHEHVDEDVVVKNCKTEALARFRLAVKCRMAGRSEA